MPRTGNQSSLYNRLVIAFVALGGTVSIPFLYSIIVLEGEIAQVSAADLRLWLRHHQQHHRPERLV